MPEPIYAEIGKLIKARRIYQGMTQVELAKGLTISRAALANIEAGRQRIYIHHLFDIARLLNIPPGYLVPRPKFRSLR